MRAWAFTCDRAADGHAGLDVTDRGATAAAVAAAT
eukprot:COSAG01_NODE_37780_length_499_cov_0.402500_1_plen_34_part_01